jgi:hypothetical protein
MSNLPQFFLVHNSLNGWLLGLARFKNSLPKPRPCLFEGIAEVGLEIALVKCSPSNQSLMSASQGSCRLPPRKEERPERV